MPSNCRVGFFTVGRSPTAPPSPYFTTRAHDLTYRRFYLAGVYLKNRINRGWSPVEESPLRTPIPEEEKPGFRERLIPALASTPPNVRAQLVPLLQKILQHDFPEQWPGFLDITLRLLGTNDANSVYAGLQCLLAICRVYRFKAGEKREEFDKIVEHSFPQLLSIGLKLVDEESLEAAEMLRIVVKSYKHAIYVGEPRAVHNIGSIVRLT